MKKKNEPFHDIHSIWNLPVDAGLHSGKVIDDCNFDVFSSLLPINP